MPNTRKVLFGFIAFVYFACVAVHKSIQVNKESRELRYSGFLPSLLKNAISQERDRPAEAALRIDRAARNGRDH